MRTPAGTLSFRAALVLSGLFAAAAVAGIAFLIGRPDGLESLRTLVTNRWWFQYQEVDPGSTLGAVWRIASAAAAACIGIVASARAYALFRKGGSPLLPFVMLFLLTLSLESLRAGTALLYAADSSISAAIVLTRVIYWGRFVGLLSLLVAGLYCIDMKYRKFAVLGGVVFLVSFAMAAYIPVDRTVFLTQLTWKLGDEQGVWFVNFMIGLLVLATSAGASFSRRDRRFLWLALGMALFLVSREMLFFAVNPWVLAGGLACLAAGAAVCLRTLSVLYRKAGEEV
jgi:hypothetical protein